MKAQYVIRGWKGIEARTGLKRQTLQPQIAAGLFPKPFNPTPDGRAVAWLEDEVAAWQAQRAAVRDAAPASDLKPIRKIKRRRLRPPKR
jgi:predicted DNA-binding transcriptional regulator AlpA